MAAPALLCIMGPTAAGKTDLAIALAQRLDGELVSVDSALVYRGLDIGAARPEYPHHLVAIREPNEPYSAAQFAEDARQTVAVIRERQRIPILVGGSQLYFKAFLDGLADIPASDPDIRREIEQRAGQLGWPALHRQLQAVDPELAARLHPNHSQRIGRGLEVWQMTGKPLSQWQAEGNGAQAREPALALVVCPADRGVLHRRIARRFELMLEQGFVDEVQRLRQRGDLTTDLPAVRAVGYRQLWSFLEGDLSFAEARDAAIAATRQLAKRQLTWLRSWPADGWLLTGEAGGLVATQGDLLGDLEPLRGHPCRRGEEGGQLSDDGVLLDAIAACLGN